MEYTEADLQATKEVGRREAQQEVQQAKEAARKSVRLANEAKKRAEAETQKWREKAQDASIEEINAMRRRNMYHIWASMMTSATGTLVQFAARAPSVVDIETFDVSAWARLDEFKRAYHAVGQILDAYDWARETVTSEPYQRPLTIDAEMVSH